MNVEPLHSPTRYRTPVKHGRGRARIRVLGGFVKDKAISHMSRFGVFACLCVGFLAASFACTLQVDRKVESDGLLDWMGSYYFGDGTGVNCYLEIKSNFTFSFKWRGCLGTYDENEGKVSVENSLIVLHPDKPNIRKGFQGTPTQFFPVAWDGRHYLVPKEEIIEFCSAVNHGEEPRGRAWGSYYLKREEWEKKVTGWPSIPQEFNAYLLSKPVEGTITRLLNNGEAIIDIGKNSGLLPGMILTAQGRADIMFCQVQIIAVEDTESKIKRRWQDSKLVVGQRVTSLFFDPIQSRCKSNDNNAEKGTRPR